MGITEYGLRMTVERRTEDTEEPAPGCTRIVISIYSFKLITIFLY